MIKKTIPLWSLPHLLYPSLGKFRKGPGQRKPFFLLGLSKNLAILENLTSTFPRYYVEGEVSSISQHRLIYDKARFCLWLLHSINLFLVVLEARSPKIKAPTDWVSGEILTHGQDLEELYTLK